MPTTTISIDKEDYITFIRLASMHQAKDGKKITNADFFKCLLNCYYEKKGVRNYD